MWLKTIVEGIGFRLRPVILSDAAFIFALRSDPKLMRFMQDGAGTLLDQCHWQTSKEQAPYDTNFIVERIHDQKQEGTVALYNYNQMARSAAWGRWILRPGSLAAPESVYLIYLYGIEILGLDFVYSRTIQENLQAVSFHDRSGLARQGTLRTTLVFRGETRDCELVEHGCRRQDWPAAGLALKAICEQAAQFVRRSKENCG